MLDMKRVLQVILLCFGLGLISLLVTDQVQAASNVVTTKSQITKFYNAQDKIVSDVAAAPDSEWNVEKEIISNGITLDQVEKGLYLKESDLKTKIYQNPQGYLQIQNHQIKPVGKVGYDLTPGVEGIKVWLVRKHFGLSNSHTIYDSEVISQVKKIQRQKGLPVTGNVDLSTWEALGFSKEKWVEIDSYVAPLITNQHSSRNQHIEAMISAARQYIGQPWISGAASSPKYGVDCSGLVTQALYASGIDPAPISAIQHAQRGHEWNSQLYWEDKRIAKVNFQDRQRGDLIFFSDPVTGKIWHIGILLNKDTMIESWPPAVQVHSIYDGRGNIVGIKRVFD